jgi:hypothetical protein
MKAWVIFFNAFTHASTSINRSARLEENATKHSKQEKEKNKV